MRVLVVGAGGVGVRDGADLVVEGYDFAPTFSIWTTIEECLNPPLIWERARAVPGAAGAAGRAARHDRAVTAAPSFFSHRLRVATMTLTS